MECLTPPVKERKIQRKVSQLESKQKWEGLFIQKEAMNKSKLLVVLLVMLSNLLIWIE